MTVKPPGPASMDQLLSVLQRLLDDGGCEWDRAQSPTSLQRYVLEEAYEVCESIEALGEDARRTVTDPGATLPAEARPVVALREELGDLLLEVLLQCALARARGWFGLDEVADGIREKLVRRHPRVFDTGAATDGPPPGWEKIKQSEQAGRSAIDGIPRALPALLAALRMGDKAARTGFDWPDPSGPRAKIDEELEELDAALAQGDPQATEGELGDLLFSIVNLARKLDLDPERALAGTNRRFDKRFRMVESRVRASGRELDRCSPDELDRLWEQAKTEA